MSVRYKRILLTGGTGFVGGYLAPAIAAAWPGAERVLLRRPGETVLRDGWRPLDAEVTDSAAIGRIVADLKPDLVLHLAAQAAIGATAEMAEATWRVNFGGTLELAHACQRACPDTTFFFVSSSEVYGWSFRDGVANEDTWLRPMNAYARAKAAAESMLPDVLPQARLIIARPFNHTGPGQDVRFVLPSLAQQIADVEAGRRPPRLELGNLEASRDFLDVRDVCAAYIAMLQSPAGPAERSVFNVASGGSWKIADLVEKFRAHARTPFEVTVDPKRLRPSDVPMAVGSAQRLQEATGWKPTIGIDAIVESLLAHWRAAGGA
ncbi:MAG: GDP-mannose 4,6-dehydratase [Rhodoblastus sp.]|nr:GDP-mannose 4,6-dehydratase [Rhodoblastus sp.]MCB1525490.1 GDP-mannose 4,6-dehydratase [Rhodoblastus sp.]MCC0000619.1 GDP-mannose 4,6-dehydratase [Methylobacteriaceae bacterium]MCO5088253.1 GDP-mannose 4,6-dehydratase [Methylobacteriaceae bacterium]HPG03065.1 GDP-mannose 4,6-dehydratase [Rhodoblastus sp.]